MSNTARHPKINIKPTKSKVMLSSPDNRTLDGETNRWNTVACANRTRGISVCRTSCISDPNLRERSCNLPENLSSIWPGVPLRNTTANWIDNIPNMHMADTLDLVLQSSDHVVAWEALLLPKPFVVVLRNVIQLRIRYLHIL